MTVYYYSVECEHDGDLRRELDELYEAGANVLDVDEPSHGDEDYYVSISFTVENWDKFTAVTGCDASDYSHYERN